ncbi:hypothetical protein FA352_23405 [Pseudomonas aeruginosa]|nr:hypothetical protein AJ66_01602 [Pseudomonas aeruginosa 3579]EZO11556.1 hypothetical protein AJ65_03669 [Pseudomonas aeruginosa 3578]MBA5391521.1 hypothetical protein [Pseudomonas aeruginosa]MBG5773745.1 hypothetical protein [Pseudomonas aeruginosa]MCC0442570.1 hypothetical protein [Pseudomonas aeruginosa]
MFNRYVVTSIVLASLVLLSYIAQFYFNLGFVISDSPEAWGQLGDYIGGTLNPLLSFVSIVLLIRSLSLQMEANKELKREVEAARKTEKLRSFEMQLFNMLDSQKTYFESFKIDVDVSGELKRLFGGEAVIRVEDDIETIRSSDDEGVSVTKYLEEVDSADQLYSLTRVFYNLVRIVDDKLSESNGFSQEDRNSYYLTIINFTDFSLLRLIMMSAQFMDYASTSYLKSNGGFNAVLDEVGLSYSLY